MLTQIINGKILTPQGWLKDGSVLISDSKILEVTNCDFSGSRGNLDRRQRYVYRPRWRGNSRARRWRP